MTIRHIPSENQEILGIMTRHWGSTDMALDDRLYDLTSCPCLLCEEAGELMGFLHYDNRGGDWEILALDCPKPGVGAGSKLIREVAAMARAAGAKRLLVVTTNDNTRAMRFYQRRGFDLIAVRFGAVTRARETIKPEIPLMGDDAIPIRHEMVFGMELY